MPPPLIDLVRDQDILSDLRNLGRLRAIQDPSVDDLRLHGTSVRRLLLDGGGTLAASAGTRRLPLAFQVPDALPYARDARNGLLAAFLLGGVEAFGFAMGGARFYPRKAPNRIGRVSMFVKPINEGLPGEFWAGALSLKLESFLRQPVAFWGVPQPGCLITRYDVITYLCNKAGVIHYDLRPTEAMPEAKLAALGLLRRAIKLGRDSNGSPVARLHAATFAQEQSSAFPFHTSDIDAVYLEFLATIGFIVNSREVQALSQAIEADIEAQR
jgi:hypothetical protein